MIEEDVNADSLWNRIAGHFEPPRSYQKEFGDFRSPLKFYDGRTVKDPEDWYERRAEIKQHWHELMGEWPEFLTDQKLHIIDTVPKEKYIQYRVSFDWLPNKKTQGYLLIPKEEGIKPAVITVFYEPETAIGEGKADRDFARQLANRGFVTLSIGTKKESKSGIYSLFYPSLEDAQVQPLSMLGYAAANGWHVLAKHPAVDPTKIGIMGHSFGGKWAMFASSLFDGFACGVWSDPGVVFDETKGAAVNYWEPWYLGYYPPPWKNTWSTSSLENEGKGLYTKLLKEGYDLHELHALMAPRPFLVSGGSSDPVDRWIALNHAIEVNKLLGYEKRVAMTNRQDHSPNKYSNEQAYLFLEYFLKHK